MSFLQWQYAVKDVGTPGEAIGVAIWDTGLLQWIAWDGSVSGGGGGGGAVTIADGADTVEGFLADAAVITDSAGTISGKMRGLVKWAYERMPASLGQKAMAASFPVVIASDQSAVPISAATLPLPTGAATEATLATRLADATFTGRINTLGQKAMAASTPVVLASDQSVIPVSQSTAAAVQAGWPTIVGGTTPSGTTTWTSATALNTAITIDCRGYSTVAFRCALSATLITPNAVIDIEGSVDGGTTYNRIPGLRIYNSDSSPVLPTVVGSPIDASVANVPSTAFSLFVDVLGCTHVRLILSTVITGATTITFSHVLSAQRINTGTLQTRIVASSSDPNYPSQALPISSTVGTVEPSSLSGSSSRLHVIASSKIDIVPSAPAVFSVGVASAEAVAANASRKSLALTNVSNARISLGFGSPAVLDSGITLYPGGTFVMDEYLFDLGAVNAIASAAASSLGVQEYT